MDPKFLEELFHKAVSLHEQEELEKACELYQEILQAMPDSPLVNYNYGLALFELEDYEKSVAYYQKASELVPNNGDILFNLGLGYQKISRFDKSIEIYRKILQLPDEQNSTDVLYNLGCCYKDQRNFSKAKETFLDVLKHTPGHQAALNNIAYLYHKDEDFIQAEAFYSKLLEINPDHHCAKHMLASLRGDICTTAPAKYVEQVFDEYSSNYDKSLVDNLKYSVPNTMRSCFEQLFSISPKSLVGLDLGCGTGLGGQEFAEFCSSFTGIDLSGKMIEKAAEKMIYTSLHTIDILNFFKDTSQQYSFILAADVFTYIGELEEIFSKIFEYSLSGAIFCFSVEKNTKSPFSLRKTGRFGHSDEYILKITQNIGWQYIKSYSTNMRMERGEWIEGMIYFLRKD